MEIEANTGDEKKFSNEARERQGVVSQTSRKGSSSRRRLFRVPWPPASELSERLTTQHKVVLKLRVIKQRIQCRNGMIILYI